MGDGQKTPWWAYTLVGLASAILSVAFTANMNASRAAFRADACVGIERTVDRLSDKIERLTP